ncbi:hypothetical protein [Zooshikella harenae]|uniref:Uncharacterized protein n=1 Tax=Zooshikella harenae TaxID=2827238 RepID=A0ABS5ZIM6_9GAMM|nr:hypothetical protein [Zooshikella harenae]MBU2713628.1 hypothetical protein [Zooshikella harenae]
MKAPLFIAYSVLIFLMGDFFVLSVGGEGFFIDKHVVTYFISWVAFLPCSLYIIKKSIQKPFVILLTALGIFCYVYALTEVLDNRLKTAQLLLTSNLRSSKTPVLLENVSLEEAKSRLVNPKVLYSDCCRFTFCAGKMVNNKAEVIIADLYLDKNKIMMLEKIEFLADANNETRLKECFD